MTLTYIINEMIDYEDDNVVHLQDFATTYNPEAGSYSIKASYPDAVVGLIHYILAEDRVIGADYLQVLSLADESGSVMQDRIYEGLYESYGSAISTPLPSIIRALRTADPELANRAAKSLLDY